MAPAFTLVAGLLLTTVGAVSARRYYLAEARNQFDRHAERLSFEVERSANQVVYGLKGARGVYAASKSVERLEFSHYVTSRDLPKEFPGALGIGLSSGWPEPTWRISSRRSGWTTRPVSR